MSVFVSQKFMNSGDLNRLNIFIKSSNVSDAQSEYVFRNYQSSFRSNCLLSTSIYLILVSFKTVPYIVFFSL